MFRAFGFSRLFLGCEHTSTLWKMLSSTGRISSEGPKRRDISTVDIDTKVLMEASPILMVLSFLFQKVVDVVEEEVEDSELLGTVAVPPWIILEGKCDQSSQVLN